MSLPDALVDPSNHTWSTASRPYLQVTPEVVAGTRFLYSNVGFELLGHVIERVTGNFHAAIRSLVLKPLDVEGYIGERPARPPAHLAGGLYASSFGNPNLRHVGTAHGGLITTAEGALKLVRAFAHPNRCVLPVVVAKDVLTVQTVGAPLPHNAFITWPKPPWGLGIELRGDPGTKHPHYTPIGVSQSSFGHYGASGSLAWCDPVRRICWAILPTFVDPFQGHFEIRQRIGQAVFAAIPAD